MISIIVPIYNVEHYVEKCITSICNQTYKELQIILVDDGSTDNSGYICDQYAKKDDRIKVIHQENHGVVAARKVGLANAKGEYIGFVDGDDFIEPDMYESLYTAILNSDADFVHSGYYKDDLTYVYGVQVEDVCEICDVEDYLMHNIFDGTNRYSMPPSNWSKLYKKELIKKAYNDVPEHISFGEDLICLCSCILNSKRVKYMNQAFYHYVRREDSVCNAIKVEHIKRENDLYDSLREFCFRYSLSEGMYDCVKRYYLRNVAICMRKLTNISIPIYQYPEINSLLDKKIIIYGAGDVGRDYYMQISKYHRCDIVAVADLNYMKYHLGYIDVMDPRKISELRYDLIVIAVLKEEIAEQIKSELCIQGVVSEKITWKRPELCI